MIIIYAVSSIITFMGTSFASLLYMLRDMLKGREREREREREIVSIVREKRRVFFMLQ
jgi:hypothetical protein